MGIVPRLIRYWIVRYSRPDELVRIETVGYIRVPRDVLLRICEALDCNIEDIMQRVPIKDAAKAE